MMYPQNSFFGALYLDRGYAVCQKFMRNVIFRRFINIDEMSQKEENYKSKLIEWCQKHQLAIEFEMLSQKMLSDRTTPKFVSRVVIEGV